MKELPTKGKERKSYLMHRSDVVEECCFKENSCHGFCSCMIKNMESIVTRTSVSAIKSKV